MPDVHTNTAALAVHENDFGEPFSQSLRDYLSDLRTTDPTINALLAADEIINKQGDLNAAK